MKISLFIPCFIDQLSPSVGISVVRIFEKLGHQVEFDESIVCCGQPAFNTGCWDEARESAVPIVEKLQDAEVVVIPWFVWSDDPRVLPRDFQRSPKASGCPIPVPKDL